MTKAVSGQCVEARAPSHSSPCGVCVEHIGPSTPSTLVFPSHCLLIHVLHRHISFIYH